MKITLFEKDTNLESFAAGQAIFREGDLGKEMFAVVSGSVDLDIRGKVVETVEAGGIFGEMALVDSGTRIASAIVTRDAKVVRVDKNRFMFLVQQTPFFSLQLMSIMAGRLRRMDEKL